MTTVLTAQTKLALASSFNGTMLLAACVTPNNLPGLVAGQMEDYFALNPESRQFAQTVVLPEVKRATYHQLRDVLAEIGYRMRLGDDTFICDEQEWKNFVDKYSAVWPAERSTG